jgi:NAD(P)-dependent dehydrogenase (short-subunit alcohol dehydrogenase family)
MRTKSSLIIGGTSGYGLALARYLVSQNEKVFVSGKSYRPAVDVLKSISGDDTHKSSQIFYKQCDITNQEEIYKLEEFVENHSENLDRLIITAALPQGITKSLLEYDAGEFINFLSINFLYQFICFKTFLRLLNKKHSNGLCIFFTSTAGWNVTPGFSIYNLSKSCLNALITNLGKDLENSKYSTKIFGLDPWEARTSMNKLSEIHPVHILPIFQAINTMYRWLPSGVIFSPDGWTKSFNKHPKTEFNILELSKSNNIKVADYVRHLYYNS